MEIENFSKSDKHANNDNELIVKNQDLLSRISELEENVKSLQRENSSLRVSLDMYRMSINISNRHSHKHMIILQRFMACVSFLKFVDERSCVTGTFVRKIFEFIFNNNELCFDGDVGNVQNTPIRILMTSDIPRDRQHHVIKFYDIINKLNYFIRDSSMSNNVFPKIMNYDYVGMNDTSDLIDYNNYVIPRKQLICKNAYDSFIIEFLAWRPSLAFIPSIDLLSFNRHGFFIMTSMDTFNSESKFVNMFSIFEQIINKQAVFVQSLFKLQEMAYPQIPVSRVSKVIYLMKLYNIVKEYYIPLIESNYSFCGHFPVIECEKIEDCPITGCSPPYLYFILECGHKISLMGYKGIVCKGDSEFSESIKCAMCRKDLIIKFSAATQSTFSVDERLIKNDVFNFNVKIFNHYFTSEEAQKMM